ncbi:unnamed protein product [Durusdinium trenchii]|uniref:ATP-dependent RNA helicase n=1 Tax=Durusdinium trenchii TaxID=1381693 RepID=A0ABP0N228_9DINO
MVTLRAILRRAACRGRYPGTPLRWHTHCPEVRLRPGTSPEGARHASRLAAQRSGVGFEDFGLHPHTLRGLREAFRFQEATKVQAQVLPQLLAPEARGSDFVIHARTGTGKTLSYLIPAIEQVVKNPPPGIGVLIVAPSRELVLQITKDAETLCSYHALQIVPLIGGIRRDKDETAIRRRRPAVLVGTLAKLIEHFEATKRFETLFDALGILVLDECDRLLAEESAESLQTFLRFLPDRPAGPAQRQTLLLSATVPEEVRDLCSALCRPNCQWLDLVQGLPTQEAVLQEVAFAPPLLMCTALRNALELEIRQRPISHKVMVFFPAARVAAFAAALFEEQLNMRIYQIHSRCTPSARMLAQEEFCKTSAGVLFTSQSSERGMDYPDVTLVLQVMAPMSRQQYIHRVGRTARAGKEGEALLLLLDHEEPFMSEIQDLPITRSRAAAQLLNDEGSRLAAHVSSARWAKESSLTTLAGAAFASLLQHLQLDIRTHSSMLEVERSGLQPTAKQMFGTQWGA